MKTVPTIQNYMTYMPKTIGFDQPLSKAQDYMRKLRVRHLPVLKGEKLVGILADRDIDLILTFKDVDPEMTTVEEVYTPDPYFHPPTSPLEKVTSEMAEKKHGCAIVVDKGKLLGVFTEMDAYKALSELLNNKLIK